MKTKLKEMLCEVKEDHSLLEKINDSTNILTDIGLDSLQTIKFILMIEDEFKVEIDFDDFDFVHMTSINTLCDYLSKCSATL